MRAALATNDDTAMIDVLQIARSEMPEAIRTMQRTLEHVVEDGRLDADESGLFYLRLNTTVTSAVVGILMCADDMSVVDVLVQDRMVVNVNGGGD